MIGSTWYLLYLTFHTVVVPVRAVCQALFPFRLSTTRTFVKLFAFVQLPFAPGVAGGRQDEVICNFSILPKNSKKWNYNDCQGNFHHFQSSWSLLSFSFCKIEKIDNRKLNKNILLLRSQNIIKVIYWVLPYFPETFNFMTKIVLNIDFVGIYEKLNLITSNKLSKIWIKSGQSNLSI